jgi:hypothetical protein
MIPNFFDSSENLKITDSGISYLEMLHKYEPPQYLNMNSFFIGSPVITISNSVLESAVINLISNEISIHTSTLRATFRTSTEDLQTLSYFEDVCGENGGNNFNLGGLALPKEFKPDPKTHELSDEDRDKIKMCKFKSIASESSAGYKNLLDLIKTGQIGTISKQVPGSISTAGVISILSNDINISSDSRIMASVIKDSPKEFYGSPSGGGILFLTSQLNFSGQLSVEGVDSPIFYNGAGSGGNIFIYDPLWLRKTGEEQLKENNWKVNMSGGERPNANIQGLQNKYFKAENGMLYSSFCPSGTSSVFCITCPKGRHAKY